MSGTIKSSLTRRILASVSLSGARARRRTGFALLEDLEPRVLLSGTKAVVDSTPPAPSAPPKSSAAQSTTSGIVPLSDTFKLNSRPSATKTIYLDFDGYTTSGTIWNTAFTNGADIVTPPFSLDSDPTTFNAAERLEIQHIWQDVAEDYAPFDVNVTTQDPGDANLTNSGGADTRWGMRVAIGGFDDDWYTGGAGGVAFVGSFGQANTPCFVFAETQFNFEDYIVLAASHEAGHTLGLSHDGTSTLGYYAGHGQSPMSWAPIMGAGYNIDITQWSKGEYPGANNHEDDLAIITSQNGFGYRADDYGNTRQTATQLPSKKVGSTRNVSIAGVIERNTDQDWFSFTTTGGTVNLDFEPDNRDPNLDISVSIYDGTGTLLGVVNPAQALNAVVSLNLPAGSYSLMVDGVGFGTLATGYSDYGSLGQYTITGTFPDTSSGTANGGNSVITGKVVSDVTNTPISGVVMFVDLDANGIFNAAVDKSARTDAQGNFTFTGLLGGSYQIYQVVPAGWQQISPSTGANSVFVAVNSTTSNVLFKDGRPPVLTGMNSAVSYTAGSTAILLTPNADVTDADTTNFKNARLTVSLIQNADVTDVLSVRNQGNGVGQVGYFGGVVRYSGLAVGTLSGGVSGSSLVITFNSSATLAIVKAVLKNLTFASSASASKLTRTVAYSLSDGTGTVSNTVTNTVKVS